MARKKAANNGAAISFEEKLWLPADKLRGSMDAAEYKQQAHRPRPRLPQVHLRRFRVAASEDRGDAGGDNVFWVPIDTL